MSQPTDYHGQFHSGSTLKNGSVSIINGQTTSTQHTKNGNQLSNFNSTGTPSSQSSRETSRDPSPTQYLHNPYRPQLTKPPMPPINGQPNSNSNSIPLQGQGQIPIRPYFGVPQAVNSSTSLNYPATTSQNVCGLQTMNLSNQFSMMSTSKPQSQAPSLPIKTDPSSLANQQMSVLPHGLSNTSQGCNAIGTPERYPTNLPPTNQNNNFGTALSTIPQYIQHSTGTKIPPNNIASFDQFPKNPPSRVINSNTQNIIGNKQESQLQFNVTQNAPANLHGPLSPQLTTNQNPTSLSQVRSSNVNQGFFSSQQNLSSQRAHSHYESSPLSTGSNISGLLPQALPLGSLQDQQYSDLSGQHSTKSIGPPPLPGQQIQNQMDNRQPYFGTMSNIPLDNMTKRYPSNVYQNDINQLNTQMGSLNVTQTGYNELWGHQAVDLLQTRNILPAEKVEPPKIKLQQEFWESANCSPDIFRCTVTKIPETNSLLQKSRLPLGILIHPFKDLNHLPLIQCTTIVRCRVCRTYINPFVYFVDSKRWKCNLCYRVNELPDEFQFDPVTKSYGDPTRRPEVKTSTIEFIAPSEYMLRPPQPAVYLFVLDVSRLAVESGYLNVICETLHEELLKLPGDGRTQVGFLAIDSAVHFFSMPDNVSQPHELIMLDVDDVFLPCPDNLIVNLKEREELVRDLLSQLPIKFEGTHDTNSALGAGLQAAYKLMSATGGRVTVFQTCLPNIGPGALQFREDPNTRASKDVQHLNPATDFYKRLALDCSGQQIAVDLFLLNSQYSDLSTLSGMCKFSGGCMYHIPLFRKNKPQHRETLEKMLRRYLTRKIGFEAVMRIRCTRGLSIHTFHGNFFVRSTDLLSLPNVNPDAGFGMQVSIEENLSDVQSVCFQAALLYTSSKGERRIRVHTLCLPVSGSLTDILYSADQQSIIGLVTKMAVDKSQQSSLSDARDALINVAIDVLSSYKLAQSTNSGALIAPNNLKLLPLYIVAVLKSISFRTGTSTRLDDRVFSMCQMKALPLCQLIQKIYPDLYPIHMLDDRNAKEIDGRLCPQPPRMHLSAEKLDFRGAFLMDAGDKIFIYIGKNIDSLFCTNILGVPSYTSIPEEMYELPELNTSESERLRVFVFNLQEEKPYYASIQIIRDDSDFRSLFIEHLIEDRSEAALSYYEFLQHLKTQSNSGDVARRSDSANLFDSTYRRSFDTAAQMAR